MCPVLCFVCLVEPQNLSRLHAHILPPDSPTALSSEVSFWIPTGNHLWPEVVLPLFGQNRATVFVLMEHQSSRYCITTGKKTDANL